MNPIVIVGAGQAGATAATELRDRGHDGPIVLIGAEGHPPYERPPLSKGYLLGNDPVEAAYVHEPQWYADHDVELHLGTMVTGVDLAGRRVVTATGRDFSYDRLLIATGSQPRRLAFADASGVPTAYLRTVEDSDRIRAAFGPGRRLVVIGAGWIGLEVAAAARAAETEVVVFEAAELPLLRVLGPQVAGIFADLHRSHGVDLRLSASVGLDDLAGADLVVVGVGVTPSVALAEAAGLAVDNGVLVDATLRTSDPFVYAVGDVANHDHPVLRRRVRVEHWDTAIEQAKVAARNVLGAGEDYKRLPSFFTDQYDLGMEYVGSVGPDGYDRVEIDGSTDVLSGGAFRAFWFKDGRVVAAMHANDWDASDLIRARVGTR